MHLLNLYFVDLYAPAVDVDRKELVVVDAPVFTLAHELSEYSESNVFRRYGHFFRTITLKEVPLAMVLRRKPTLRNRRR